MVQREHGFNNDSQMEKLTLQYLVQCIAPEQNAGYLGSLSINTPIRSAASAGDVP